MAASMTRMSDHCLVAQCLFNAKRCFREKLHLKDIATYYQPFFLYLLRFGQMGDVVLNSWKVEIRTIDVGPF